MDSFLFDSFFFLFEKKFFETGVFAVLSAALKSEDSSVVEYSARVLEFFAQDCVNDYYASMQRLEIPNQALAALKAVSDGAKCSLLGLLFWIAQDGTAVCCR